MTRVTIHGPSSAGRYQLHAADCSDNAAGGYPLTVEVEHRAAVVYELWADEIREDGDYKSRRDGLRFPPCLRDLPENSG